MLLFPIEILSKRTIVHNFKSIINGKKVPAFDQQVITKNPNFLLTYSCDNFEKVLLIFPIEILSKRVIVHNFKHHEQKKVPSFDQQAIQKNPHICTIIECGNITI